MKKRIISLLLTVLMVMSLFSGLSVDAYAAQYNGANVIEYTMGQNDYVLRICQSLGLNYYTCKDAIMILNGIQDGQWNKLSVGTDLLLPASDYDAVLIANGARPTTGTTGAAATTATTNNVIGTATTGTAANTAASSADVLGYYIVPYTLSYGETVSGVCNSLGVNFSIFGGFIKQLNNVSSWNKVRAGDTIVIPTPYAPSVGTTCYGVMEHIVTNSDTAYGIVTSKGLNYNANERVLKVLNQTDNLAAVNAGQKFFYAVPLTVNVPGTANPGSTATTTTTTTVTDGNGTTTTQTTTTAKLYKLSSGMSASDGTMLFYVGSKPVTAASAGTKVTVVTSTNSGKAIQSLTVKQSDGKADFLLTADTFVMPACDVRVDASIKSGHNININANYSGKASATVGGISVMSAVKGATVVVKSADPNYEISSVYATYKKIVSSSTKVQLTVSASKAFIMPDADVDLEIVLKPVSTYAFYVNDPSNGTFYLEVNGSPVTRAAKGAQVTVVAKPIEGYEPVELTVMKHGSTSDKVNVYSNSFIMPAFDVDVTVTFAGKGNNILVMPSQLGNVYAFDSKSISDASQFITEAVTGADIYLVAINEEGNTPVGLDKSNSKISYDVVRTSDGLKVNCNYVGDDWNMTVDGTNTKSSYYTFKMPKGGVTVTPTITQSVTKDITAKFILNGTAKTGYNDCGFSITWNGKTSNFTQTGDKISVIKGIKSAIPVGEYLDLRYDDSTDGIAFVKFRITDTTGAIPAGSDIEEANNEANLHGYFKMPGQDIQIEAYFENGKAALGPAVITGVGTVTYRNAANTLSINSCNPGDKVLMSVVPGNGFGFEYEKYADRLIVTRKDNGARLEIKPENVVPSQGIYVYSFEMPASGVDVQAIFDAKPFVITMRCVDEAGNILTGKGLWQVAINMQPGVVDNDPNKTETKFTVAYEDYVTVAMTEAGWSEYDMVSFRINDKEYIADVLNYFYNFQMIDERAQNLNIVAVLRPRVPYTVGVHSLYAYQYDSTKGGVDFVILESYKNYDLKESRNGTGALNYVHNAVTGDKVGIVVNALADKYTVKPENISIMAVLDDADRIVPTEAWVDAWGNPVAPNTPDSLHVFYFTMPNSDVYVGVNFTGKDQILMINVVDENDQPISGMARLFVNNVYRDIGADNSFDDVAYNTPVQITRSELAIAESRRIDKVDIRTKDGKSVNYVDMSNGGEGISFLMPASSVYVYIKLGYITDTLPTVLISTQVTNGTLVLKKSTDKNAPSCSLDEFKVGETVYIYGIPSSGYEKLGIGDLKVYVNGQNNAANLIGYIDEFGNVVDEADSNGNNVSPLWQFKLPAGAVILKADFAEKEAAVRKIKILINGQTEGKVKLTIGDYTGTYSNNTVVQAKEGQTITIVPETSTNITRISSRSGKGIDGNTYTVPTGLTADSDGNWDELTIELPAQTTETVKVKIISDNTAFIVAAGVTGEFKSAAGIEFNLPAGTVLTITSHTTGLDKVTLTTNHSNKGVSGNTYTVPSTIGTSDELTIKLEASGNPINSTVGSNGKVLFYADPGLTTQILSSNVQTDDPVYIVLAPDTGYEKDTFKVTAVVGGKEIVPTGTGKSTDPYCIAKMPEGGINVTTTFKIKNLMITLRILDKSYETKDISTATKLSETVKIKVNGTEVTYKDGDKIDTKTAQQIVFPSKASSHWIDSIQSYKNGNHTNGTVIKSLNYTVVGNEEYMVIFLDTSKPVSSGVTEVPQLVEIAEPQPEYTGNTDEAGIPEDAADAAEAGDAAEAEAGAEVEIPDYPKIQNDAEADAPSEETAPAEGEA